MSMRIAIIDLGTNSVRFDVYQLGPRKAARVLHREKLMVRLGQGVFTLGKLDRDAVQRTLHAFIRFKEAAEHFRASKIIAFGTSALREASDRDQLTQKIFQRTGIQVRVISGGEEAKLIARGILSNEKKIRGKFALLDIGGGSTEVSICSGSKILHCESFPLGTARLQQIFLKKSPPSSQSIADLRKFIRETLAVKIIAEKWPKVDVVIGSSGTVRAVDRILKKSHYPDYNVKSVTKLNESMSKMNTTRLLGVPGMEAKRVDMILAGSVLLEEAMRILSAKKVKTSTYSLRHGILSEELELFRQHKTSHLGLHIQEIYDKAVRFGSKREQLEQTFQLAGVFFDSLRKIHRLKPQWKIYLQAASVLKSTGQAISHSASEMHSYYIVRNADIPSLDPWESEFIAQLCFHLKAEKVSIKKIPMKLDSAKRKAFVRLLSLLQVATAFETVRVSKGLKSKAVRVCRNGRTIKVLLSKKYSTGLELARLERSKKLFEKTFKKQITTEIK